MRKTVLLFVVVMCVLTTLHAQFWEKKEPAQWSKSDCEKMLTDSPWAQTRVVYEVLQDHGSGPVPRSVDNTGREVYLTITYHARLLSALPVRQALVRSSELNLSIQKLPPAQQKKIQEENDYLLNATDPDHVVVQVVYSSNVTEHRRELDRAWDLLMKDRERLKLNVFLNTSVGKIRPVDILRPGPGEFQLVFVRQQGGKPIVQLTDKSVSVEFEGPPVGVFRAERIFIEFKVKNMMVNGQLVY
jgi:hypothetical protein